MSCHFHKISLTLKKTSGSYKGRTDCSLKFNDTLTEKFMFIFHTFKLFYKNKFQKIW